MEWKVKLYERFDITIPPEELKFKLINTDLDSFDILLSEYMDKEGKAILEVAKRKRVNLTIYIEKDKMFRQLSFLLKNFPFVNFGGLVISPYEYFKLPLKLREKLPLSTIKEVISQPLNLERLIWEGNYKLMEKIDNYNFTNYQIINLALFLGNVSYMVRKGIEREKKVEKKEVVISEENKVEKKEKKKEETSSLEKFMRLEL